MSLQTVCAEWEASLLCGGIRTVLTCAPSLSFLDCVLSSMVGLPRSMPSVEHIAQESPTEPQWDELELLSVRGGDSGSVCVSVCAPWRLRSCLTQCLLPTT